MSRLALILDGKCASYGKSNSFAAGDTGRPFAGHAPKGAANFVGHEGSTRRTTTTAIKAHVHQQ